MKQPLARRLASTLLIVQIGLAPAQAQTGAYCPIVPQTQRPSADVFKGEEVLDMTGSASRRSTRLRVANASASTLVFIDSDVTRDQAALSALRKSKAQIVLKTDAGPSAARALLTHRIGSVSVLATIPQDAAGVAATYRPETVKIPGVLAEYKSAGQRLSALPNGLVVSSATTKQTIRQRLLAEAGARQTADLLVVVGHNQDGLLKLPDGSSLQLDELARTSEKSGRPVLVLSCETVSADIHAAGFVTTRPLYFDEIGGALNAALLGKANHGTVGEFVRSMNVALAAEGSDGRRAKIIAAVAVIGSTVLVMAILNASDCGPLSREKCE